MSNDHSPSSSSSDSDHSKSPKQDKSRDEPLYFLKIIANRISRDKLKDIEYILKKKDKYDDDLVGPVEIEFFDDFCIDKSVDSDLVRENENANLREMLEPPKYDRLQTLLDGTPKKSAASEAAASSRACWNCGMTDHSVNDCPMPRNEDNIRKNRKVFLDQKMAKPKEYLCAKSFDKFHRYGKRFFVDNPYSNFKPGVYSDELKRALGMGTSDVSPLLDRMKRYGFPPSYVAYTGEEKSGLKIYGLDPDEPEKPAVPEGTPTVGADVQQPYLNTSYNMGYNTPSVNSYYSNYSSTQSTPTNAASPYANYASNYGGYNQQQNQYTPQQYTTPVSSPSPYSVYQSTPNMYSQYATSGSYQAYSPMPSTPNASTGLLPNPTTPSYPSTLHYTEYQSTPAQQSYNQTPPPSTYSNSYSSYNSSSPYESNNKRRRY